MLFIHLPSLDNDMSAVREGLHDFLTSFLLLFLIKLIFAKKKIATDIQLTEPRATVRPP